MFIKAASILIGLVALALPSFLRAELVPGRAAKSEPSMLVVNLEEDKNIILKNPGIGWETNNDIRSPDLPESETPPSSIAYFKYYLKTFLRENGMIDLSTLAKDLERSRRAGQQAAIRLMAYGEEEGADIMRSFGASKGYKYRYDDGSYKGPELWAPDLDDPANLAILEKLLREVGRRFDGHADLAHIDIGYVGLWGEWHNSDTKPRLRMPSIESQRRIIDMHFTAFPTTRKIMQLQEATSLRYALNKGAGLRGDCLGAPDTTMMRLYPLTMLAARANDAWKRAPVIFEICWKLSDWQSRGWDTAAILETALNRYHASAINTKSPGIPSSLRPAFDDFLRRAGYRFVLRSASYPRTQERIRRLQITTHWDNVGVAPCYDDFRVLVRLESKDKTREKVFPLSAQLCGREPDKFSLPLSIPPLMSFPPGDYELSLGVAARSATTPSISLANKGGRNYWYPLGALELQ